MALMYLARATRKMLEPLTKNRKHKSEISPGAFEPTEVRTQARRVGDAGAHTQGSVASWFSKLSSESPGEGSWFV